MSLEITQHNPEFSTVGQINPEDIVQIAALGYKSVIDNRPDHEGGAWRNLYIVI
jgi:sulfide:quinone oxidoreductase